MRLTFVEMPWFTQRLKARLDDLDYRQLQRDLLLDPAKGEVMPGCGGLRKIRAADSKRGKGKRGGARLIYLYIPEACRIDLFDVYGKDEKDDLTQDEKKALATLVKQTRTEAIAACRKSQRGVK